MSKPWVHAVSSARKFGGQPEDYIEVHNFLDSSKGAIGDSRHRALTHTTWFLSNVLERVFGVTLVNSTGRRVSIRDIGEQHVLEDYGGRFIPTVQDFLEDTPFKTWMLQGRGEAPPSMREPEKHANETRKNRSDVELAALILGCGDVTWLRSQIERWRKDERDGRIVAGDGDGTCDVGHRAGTDQERGS